MSTAGILPDDLSRGLLELRNIKFKLKRLVLGSVSMSTLRRVQLVGCALHGFIQFTATKRETITSTIFSDAGKKVIVT